jgi:hypothetical protein
MLKNFPQKYAIQIILLASFLVFFHHLSQPGFFLDGLIYAAFGKNAAVKGAWLVPTMNDAVFKEFSDHISFLTARLFINLFSFSSLMALIYFTFKNKKNDFQVLMTGFIFLLSYPLLRHSRHPNFDIPLMLMSFLAMNFYIEALEFQKKKSWFFVGAFFGLAMLFKGPMAIFIPTSILMHLIITKRLKVLLSISPWLALLMGLVIFSLWPLGLYLNGKFYIFTTWFNFTFITAIAKSRGVTTNDYLAYVKYLSTFTPIHIALSLYTFYKIYKTKWTNFYAVHFTFVLTVLFITCLTKYKLSHYITSLYPSLAIIACYGINDPRNPKFKNAFLYAILIISIGVFFMPQDYKKTRDYEIFEIRRILKEKKLTAAQYITENQAYTFWSQFALIEFLDGVKTLEVKSEDLKIEVSNTLFIIKDENSDLFINKCTFIYKLEKFNSKAFHCQ